MSLLDSILGQVGQTAGIDAIASKLGIDPAMAEQAVSALAANHTQPGDTVEAASAQTGIDSGTMTQVLEQVGGNAALGELNQVMANHPQAAGLLNMFDRDGDGNPVNDIIGMASGLFGKK